HAEAPWSFFEHKARVLGFNAALSVTDDLLKAIQQGEDQHVEFKESVDPSDKNKLKELVRSVIAFSNTDGGVIIIGVSDDCEIVGISSRQLHKWRGQTGDQSTTVPTDLLKAYAASVRKHINENIRPSPAILVEDREVAGRALVTITVTQGKDKPYQDIASNTVWVRHGANDRRPSQEELKTLCCVGSPGTFANGPDPFRG
ncbi:ATPase associated with various cellular activities, AAA-4, partial [mine drainage metagenome]